VHGGSNFYAAKYSARATRVSEPSRTLVFLLHSFGWNHDGLSVDTGSVATISEMTFPFLDRLYTILYRQSFEAEFRDYLARNGINKFHAINTVHEFESLSLRHNRNQ